MDGKHIFLALLTGVGAACADDDGGMSWQDRLRGLVPDKVKETFTKDMPDKVKELAEKHLPDEVWSFILDYLPEELASKIQELRPEEVQKKSDESKQALYEPRDLTDAHNHLLSCCAVCAPQIRFKFRSEITKRDIRKLVDTLLSSAGSGCSYGSYDDAQGNHILYISPSYKSCYKIMAHIRHPEKVSLTADESDALMAARDILKKLDIDNKPTPLSKARAIHDWLVLNCAYDVESYKGKKSVIKMRRNYSHFDGIYMILEHRGVCESYSQAYWMLLQMCNVPCCIVHGRAGELHAWNLVYLNDHWAHIDVTHDDPIPDEEGRLVDTFFDKSDRDMKKLGRKWNHQSLTTERNLYMYQRPEDFVAVLLKEQKKQTQSYDILLDSKSDVKNFSASLSKALKKEGLTGSFTCSLSPYYNAGITVSYTKGKKDKKKAK